MKVLIITDNEDEVLAVVEVPSGFTAEDVLAQWLESEAAEMSDGDEKVEPDELAEDTSWTEYEVLRFQPGRKPLSPAAAAQADRCDVNEADTDPDAPADEAFGHDGMLRDDDPRAKRRRRPKG